MPRAASYLNLIKIYWYLEGPYPAQRMESSHTHSIIVAIYAGLISLHLKQGKQQVSQQVSPYGTVFTLQVQQNESWKHPIDLNTNRPLANIFILCQILNRHTTAPAVFTNYLPWAEVCIKEQELLPNMLNTGGSLLFQMELELSHQQIKNQTNYN